MGALFCQALPPHAGFIAYLAHEGKIPGVLLRPSTELKKKAGRPIELQGFLCFATHISLFQGDNCELFKGAQFRHALPLHPGVIAYLARVGQITGILLRPRYNTELEKKADRLTELEGIATHISLLQSVEAAEALRSHVTPTSQSPFFSIDDNVTVLGIMSWLSRKDSGSSETRAFMRERYLVPAQDSIDRLVRTMRVAAPEGPLSRLFAILLVYNVMSQTAKDATSAFMWLKETVGCHRSRNRHDLKLCLLRFSHNFYTALKEDACGWAPVVLERD